MRHPAFVVHQPAALESCVVFSSPHSGADYPEALMRRTQLSPLQIRSSEDAFVDELFGAAPGCGAPLLAARIPRACVDLNRAPDDLDPALIAGASRRYLNPRIAAGLGVIPRVVAEGRTIIEGKISLAEANRLLASYWRPYHATLGGLVEERRRRFGAAVLFDCHSMPRDAIHSAPSVGRRMPDVVLGDRFGAACARWLTEAVGDAFRAEGFTVARNAPFAGGYITQAYGRPREGAHAIQIEVDRSLYMDERRIERLESFDEVRTRLSSVVARIATLRPGEALPVAAE